MISKRFDELGILVYYKYSWKYEVKNDFYNLSLLFTHSLKKALKNKWLKSEIFRNHLWNSLSVWAIVVIETLPGQS